MMETRKLRRKPFCKNYPFFKGIPRDLKSPYLPRVSSQEFVQCLCEKTCIATKRLNLSGSIVNQKIGRLLRNTDIPALLIFLENNPSVTNINLAYNDLSDAGFINLLDHSLLHGNIRELDLQCNNVTTIGINYMLKSVGNELKIESLRLRGNKFGVEGAKKLAHFLLENSNLLHLDVAEVDQTASSLAYFIGVLNSNRDPHNSTLKSLDISRPNPGCMYYFDKEHFACIIGLMLRHNAYLAELRLRKYSFDCHDIEDMILNARYNTTLRLLDLGSNNIGDHGIDHLAEWLIEKPDLRILILTGNIVTDSGARRLSFVMPFSKLLSLDISYNRIKDNGIIDILNSIKKSPLLRELKIFGNCIGDGAGKIIHRMLISKVLIQANIDVKPYSMDDGWCIAKYQGGACKQKFYDVPYFLTSQPTVRTKGRWKYCKYVYPKISDIVQLQTDSTESDSFESWSIKDHSEDCKCCFCLKCKEGLGSCRNDIHPNDCPCCRCKTRDSSSDFSFGMTDKFDLHSVDSSEPIASILKRVSSETRVKISRWMNMDEKILEEDLKMLSPDQDQQVIKPVEPCEAPSEAPSETPSETQSKSEDSCTCSWIPLSMCMVKRYIEGVPLDEILHPKEKSAEEIKYCTDIS